MLAHREQLVLPLQLGQGGTDALDPDIRLDAAGAAARALPAVPEEGGVAPLAGGVADPAQQLAVDDHAGADPGGEVDGEEVAVPTKIGRASRRGREGSTVVTKTITKDREQIQ